VKRISACSGKALTAENKKLSKGLVETPTVFMGSVYMGGVTVPKAGRFHLCP
jgi:hypothetical protein